LARFQKAAAESSLFSGIVQFQTLSSETLSSQALSSEVLSSWTESLLSWSQAVRHAAASEWLASWGLRPGEIAAQAESSAALSSAALCSLEFAREFSAAQAAASWFSLFAASWAPAERSSWTAAAAARGEFPTSWGAAEISSWQSLASWSQAIGASWLGAEIASWSRAAISSWTQEVLSSWFRETFSSWNVETLSSWFRETLSSWSAETLSSWTSETLSSWARSELGAISSAALASWEVPPSAREFFMNVNAEVIFYGGTDPRAQVTIAGRPIQLNPDGTFRYHFIFPNNRYEIPIVATSPDGVETRSAILRFERQTQKTGKVEDTLQPPLGEPMGKQ
ncbi:MAG: hypothetical protein NZL93_02660, partial [Chthoniobacterales bacterium]|nr:hypothetical protein [Chthoniobacterales bacterium]